MPRFLTSLRAKLALATLLLLVIPWVGYRYVKAMEDLLRETQVQSVTATARAVAAALQDRPRLLELRGPTPAEGSAAESRPVSEEVQPLMSGLARAGSRIWVVDSRLRLVAVAGSLDTAPPAAATPVSFGVLERAVRAMLEPLFEVRRRDHKPPNEEVIQDNVVFGGRELERALDGTPSWLLRTTTEQRGILTAWHPVWVGDHVVAVVVVEETTQPVLSFSSRALEQLVVVTLIVFVAGGLALFLFASRLSTRLRRLRDEADNAIDSQGRVRGLVAGERAGDEIGDLSRGFSTVLARLAQYNDYLERMAGRLSHEIRTPIAVVRSSLDNLRAVPLPAPSQVYLVRANEGLSRLDTVLTRITEATRIEQLVRGGDRERFDARDVLSGSVAAYASIYPNRRFVLDCADIPLHLHGDRDLFAQMLDKLAANAVDFACGDDPIHVTLNTTGHETVLSFANTGPPLPANMQGQLFQSMVSVRPGTTSTEPHLGLGLYVVRLIAEYHGGRVSAANRKDGSGVVFELVFSRDRRQGPLTVY